MILCKLLKRLLKFEFGRLINVSFDTSIQIDLTVKQLHI
jgi:hypothetical protein